MVITSTRQLRLSLCGLVACIFILGGCSYYVSGYNYTITVNTSAAPTPTYTGMATTLSASYATDNVSLYLTAHDWSVVNAAGPYVLQDNGFTAQFTPGIAGQYTIRYRTWYYTNYDYCCYATGYRESYVVVTVLTPVPG